MNTTSLTIELPADMKAFVDKQTSAQGFATADEYIFAVLAAEDVRQNREEIEKHLLEGLDSPATPMTKKDWQNLRKSLKEKMAKKRKT